MWPVVTERVLWSVCPSVTVHPSVCPPQSWAENGCTVWDVIWVLDSDGTKEPCVRWGWVQITLCEKANALVRRRRCGGIITRRRQVHSSLRAVTGLANTGQPSVCNGYVAFCQITLTTCSSILCIACSQAVSLMRTYMYLSFYYPWSAMKSMSRSDWQPLGEQDAAKPGTTTQQQPQPFTAVCPELPRWAGTRRNTYHPVFISFLHLPRSIASSLFKLCDWQSFCTTSFHVFFGLPLGLEPSTSYSIHFFTQSVSSFRT